MRKRKLQAVMEVGLLLACAAAGLSAQADARALLEAVRRGDLARVEALIAASVNVDARNHEGRTALMLAAREGHEAIIDALLEAGASPDLQDDRGNTALVLAVTENDVASVRLLIEGGADVSHRDHDGLSALTIAEAAGAAEIVSLLRAAGARTSLEERLHEAIRSGSRVEVARLLRWGADVDALDPDDFQTPIMAAIEHDRLEILLWLVKAGADPTREGTGIETTGENAITLAARKRSPWALRILLNAKARPRDRDEALLRGCADPNVVRVALEAGANPNARGRDGVTALMCAASEGSEDAVATLLEAGADPNAASSEGTTAVAIARRNGHDAIVALLERAAAGR